MKVKGTRLLLFAMDLDSAITAKAVMQLISRTVMGLISDLC
jgi:hypothetical protein